MEGYAVSHFAGTIETPELVDKVYEKGKELDTHNH